MIVPMMPLRGAASSGSNGASSGASCAPRPRGVSSSAWSRRMAMVLAGDLHVGVAVLADVRRSHQRGIGRPLYGRDLD